MAGPTATDGTIRIYTLAAAREKTGTGGGDITSMAESRATVVAPTLAHPNIPDLTETFKLPNGITYVGASAGANNFSNASSEMAIAVLNSLATGSTTNRGSSTSVWFGGFHTGSWSATSDRVPAGINQEWQNGADAYFQSSASQAQLTKFRLCFASGGTDQSALVTIGNDGGGSGVTTEIKSGPKCGEIIP